MQFELYTTKTVKDCMKALTERMEAKETKTRPAINGWIEKGGRFSVAVSSRVGPGFTRTTRLTAEAERSSGVTVIRGYVATGVPRERVGIAIGALVVVALVLVFNGDAVLGLLVALTGAALYIPLVGDHNNRTYLLKELRKILDAKDKPPKS